MHFRPDKSADRVLERLANHAPKVRASHWCNVALELWLTTEPTVVRQTTNLISLLLHFRFCLGDPQNQAQLPCPSLDCLRDLAPNTRHAFLHVVWCWRGACWHEEGLSRALIAPSVGGSTGEVPEGGTGQREPAPLPVPHLCHGGRDTAAWPCTARGCAPRHAAASALARRERKLGYSPPPPLLPLTTGRVVTCGMQDTTMSAPRTPTLCTPQHCSPILLPSPNEPGSSRTIGLGCRHLQQAVAHTS